MIFFDGSSLFVCLCCVIVCFVKEVDVVSRCFRKSSRFVVVRSVDC